MKELPEALGQVPHLFVLDIRLSFIFRSAINAPRPRRDLFVFRITLWDVKRADVRN